MRAACIVALVILAGSLAAQQSGTQQDCLPPSLTSTLPAGVNIFSEQQEIDLGDAMAESSIQMLVVLRQSSLNDHLRELGDRLLQSMPPSKLHFQFVLIDLPEPNAFSLPGGRVYVSRKVVALAQNDDELAGILAHELGHIITHQSAIEMTRRFRDVLGVTQLGDRADVFDKFHHYLESYRRKPDRGGPSEEGHQEVADQVAVFAAAKAGYSPQAYLDIWDRFQQTHGKTGNWLSDVFGVTTPSERRLRDMRRNMALLPPGCASARAPADPASYRRWQSQVINSEDAAEESLPGLISRQELPSPLRPDINTLRFSPDAKYVIAQDDGGIHVLTREPFAEAFFIDAPNAYPAMFSPDSKSLVFYSPSFRVESWDVASHQRNWVHEVLLRDGCIQSALAPDGSAIGCLTLSLELTLLDVAGGATLLRKSHFLEHAGGNEIIRLWFLVELSQPIQMAYSPDGRYFLAGTYGQVLAYDLQRKELFNLPGSIRHLMSDRFAFVGQDRIAGVDPYNPEHCPILRFPEGNRLGDVSLSDTTNLETATHGDYVLLWPLREQPLGILNLKTRKIFAAFKHKAGDIYDDWILTERNDGEVGIFDLNVKKITAVVALNRSYLGRPEAADVSTDFNWLAISTASRGAVWDLKGNRRVQLTPEFNAAWFASDDSLYADFPKKVKPEESKGNAGARRTNREDKTEQTIGKLDASGRLGVLYELGKDPCRQQGPYLICRRPSHPDSDPGRDSKIEVLNLLTKGVLWSRYFPKEVPEVSMQSGHRVLLDWPLSDSAGREEMQKFTDLKGNAERDDHLIELLDLSSDRVSGKILLKTTKRSFEVEQVAVDGDWLLVSASDDQVLIYSLAKGEEKAHVFGDRPSLSAMSGQFAVRNSLSQVNVYDLATGAQRRQLEFGRPVIFQEFSPDGQRLFVLSGDETAYTIDLRAH